ncbi:hypothetical protein [Nitrosomonas ureae]|uniref:Uncharacterized protein n=1 Tax=Nitrosomonas ureae TaxID=44577 RepID=A0A1H2FZ39_9PROT|nr:hypothetical protein [Nitrosomonas ureae]ALQ51456.1 hypothetical protein ATY38_09640 [Nitrosomonas ureae]SDU12510.1 hypothetical protein SAMN05216406_12612 [Nitrosomonas ureae]
MTTTPDRIRHVSLKIDRAKAHAAALRDAVRQFFDTKPYTIGAKQHPATRKVVYYIEQAPAAPDDLPLLAGDTIQNLTTALDHLAYQLVCKDTGDAPPNPRGIYFPIADDQAKYDASKANRLPGASPNTIACIDAVRPYRGGNDALWRLGRLNNVEKHRLLFTVGSQAAGIHLGQLMSNLAAGSMPPDTVAAFAKMDIYINPADKGFPLQPGFELYIGQVNEVADLKQQFRFQLVLHEPGIAEGLPLIETIDEMIAAVDSVTTDLVSLLE